MRRARMVPGFYPVDLYPGGLTPGLVPSLTQDQSLDQTPDQTPSLTLRTQLPQFLLLEPIADPAYSRRAFCKNTRHF